jgi:hypothetical protein
MQKANLSHHQSKNGLFHLSLSYGLILHVLVLVMTHNSP